RLNEIAAIHRGAWGVGRLYRPIELGTHRVAEVAAMLLIGAEDLDALERIQPAQRLQMRARLPTAAEQRERSGLPGRQVLRSYRAHGGHAHLLDDPVGHDRDRLDFLE